MDYHTFYTTPVYVCASTIPWVAFEVGILLITWFSFPHVFRLCILGIVHRMCFKFMGKEHWRRLHLIPIAAVHQRPFLSFDAFGLDFFSELLGCFSVIYINSSVWNSGTVETIIRIFRFWGMYLCRRYSFLILQSVTAIIRFECVFTLFTPYKSQFLGEKAHEWQARNTLRALD